MICKECTEYCKYKECNNTELCKSYSIQKDMCKNHPNKTYTISCPRFITDPVQKLLLEMHDLLGECMTHMPGVILTSDMGRCKVCGILTSSGMLNYCDKCLYKEAQTLRIAARGILGIEP